jgi:hypothetical protein
MLAERMTQPILMAPAMLAVSIRPASGNMRLLLAPAFGLSMGLSLTVAWLLLGRALTKDTLTATLFLVAAGAIAAGLALAAARLLRGRASSARFAAAFVLLAGGTVGLTSVFMMLHTVLRAHDLIEVPIGTAFAITTISTAAALHNFLTLAGLSILPFALPVIAAFAVLIARISR